MSAAALRVAAATAALLACVTAAAADAADAIYDAARQTAAAAQELQAQGGWDRASALLQGGQQRCGDGAAGLPCRLLLRYTLGYLSEREAQRTPALAADLLAAAQALYLEVLASAPQHQATLKNLALLYLYTGRPLEAASLLERAVESDRAGPDRGALLLLLAQVYRDDGRFDAALASMERAVAADPGDASGPRAIAALFADGPAERLGALLPRLAEWAPLLPAVAEEGYRTILMRAPGSATAEQALLPWVSLIARQGWVSDSTLAGLPRGWEPLDGLLRYAAEPETEPGRSGWWMAQPQRRSVLAQVALATARSAEARDDPARALRRLEVGLRISPEYEEYQFRPELKDAWPTRMELARAALSLLSRNPALDPQGMRQQRLVGELFSGKAGAYRSEDVVAMQRFHTTLGRWYAERGEWRGGGATNARFQLEHAIGTAAQRAQRGEPYQPLQDEKEMLAQGYLGLGEATKARSMFLDATAAFLDTDQFEPARQALDAAARITAPAAGADVAAQAARTALLRQVLTTREALASGPVAEGFERLPGQSWLRGDNDPQGFLGRQRFKALADLAFQSDVASRTAAAFQAALAVRSLVGTADLVRLERITSLSTRSANLADRRTPIVAARPAVAAGGVTWAVYVPAESQALYTALGADTVLAARIDAVLRGDAVTANANVRYSVDGGAVKVYLPPPAVGARSAAPDLLKQLAGVRSVTLEVK